METKIITDHKWKQLKYGYEVPASVLEDCDHLEDDEKMDGWIYYRSRWYHVSDFIMFYPNYFGYDGYLSDSFFSGVLIKLDDDGESCKIATYIS